MSSGIESDSWVGRKLGAGRYEIRKLLGQGGMGFVFLARDTRLETDVVIKFPHRSLLTDPDFVRRFARETRSLIKLEHPHIVRINDVGEEEGMPFLVMPFLGGGSLNDRRPRDEKGNYKWVRPSNLRGWVLDAAKALDFIHDRGYVHRDIKPDNILFDAYQNVYISDFGIAKAVGESAEKQTNLTGTGVIGTPGYIAPEILLGHSYDGRSDQYSLAVAVYEVLAGRRPFEGATPAVIIGLQTMKPAPALREVRKGLPEALTDVVMRALDREPANRFPSCVDFARALEETLNGPAAGGVRIPAHSPDEKTVTYHEACAAAADSDTGTAQNRRTLVQPVSAPQPPPLTARTQRTSSSPSAASSATIGTVPSSGGPPAVPPARQPTSFPAGEASFLPPRRKTSASLVVFWSFFVLLLAGGIGGAVWWIGSQKKPSNDNASPAQLSLSERKDNLKQIGVAFHGYHDAHRHFPAADAPGYGPGSGRINHRGLSWRVHLLPYLNQQALYDQFRLDEPWDSAHNKKLIDKMPAVFQSPGVSEPGKTGLHVFVGPGTPFATSQGKPMISFLNGLSNTLLVVESGPEKADIWTKPGGIPYEPDGSPRSMLGKVMDGEFLVLMADGSVRQYSLSLDQNTLRQLVEYRTDPQRIRRGDPPASDHERNIGNKTIAPPQKTPRLPVVRKNNPFPKTKTLSKGAPKAQPVPQPVPGSAVKPAAALQSLLAEIAPGTQWKGTSQASGKAAQRILVTFVETRDNGRYVRAIVQAEESTAGPNPFTLAVYEGLVTNTAGQSVVTLKKKRNTVIGLQASRDWGILFSSYEVTLTLRLAKKGELQGVASYYGGREQVELQKAGRLQPFADPLQIAREVTTPGTVWQGTLQHNTQAAEQMALIFTEVRDEGKYVRAMAVPKDDPFNLVILEGTVLSDDVRRHAFAIQLRKKTSGWSRENLLFGKYADRAEILLHCSFDGQKLYGLAGHYSGTDRLILTRMNPQPKFVALDTRSFTQAIRQACAPGKKWVGELQNLNLKSGAKIEVRFGQQNAAGTTVQVLFRLPRVRGADVLFAGTFRLDDVNVNGYCLELKKVGGGVKDRKTTLFNDDTNWTVYLGLNPTGQQLYGYATYSYRGLVEKFVLSPAGTDTLKKKTNRR